MSGAGPLVSAAELYETLAAPAVEDRPILLDVRWELATGALRADYEHSHIPGAAFVDLDTDLAGAPGRRGRHPLPAPAAFEAAMRRAGVREDRAVVVYDAGPATAAARAWWLLRYFGHGRVAVLDGGFAAWCSAGNPVARGAERAEAGDFTARPGGMAMIDAEAAASLARHGVLLDARAAKRYRGEHEPVDPVAGHIPGARSAPAEDNVDENGRFREAGALRSAFAERGVARDRELGAYCGSGVTAAHAVLALELAGFRAALYPGSWSEWIQDRHRPVAVGPEPG